MKEKEKKRKKGRKPPRKECEKEEANRRDVKLGEGKAQAVVIIALIVNYINTKG